MLCAEKVEAIQAAPRPKREEEGFSLGKFSVRLQDLDGNVKNLSFFFDNLYEKCS